MLEDCGGSWEVLVGALEERWARGGHSFQELDFEAKRSHMEDLRRRLEEAGLDPAGLVGDLRQDKRILRKARTRILQDYVREENKTVAMRMTPRRVLSERAWRGEWDRFPVSPAVYEPLFQKEIRRRSFYNEDETFTLRRRIEAVLTKNGGQCASSSERRLAFYRAGLTALVDAMEMVDDSCGVIAELFEDVFNQYIAVPWTDTAVPPRFTTGIFSILPFGKTKA